MYQPSSTRLALERTLLPALDAKVRLVVDYAASVNPDLWAGRLMLCAFNLFYQTTGGSFAPGFKSSGDRSGKKWQVCFEGGLPALLDYRWAMAFSAPQIKLRLVQTRTLRVWAGVSVLVGVLLVAGCASRSMMLTSRIRENAPLELQRNITLAAQPSPQPEDVKLKGVPTALPGAAGLQAETPLTASYVMGCSMDESWEKVEVPVVAVPPREQVSAYPAQNGVPGRTVTTYEFQDPFNLQKTSRYLPVQGVRLVLYPKCSPAPDQPERFAKAASSWVRKVQTARWLMPCNNCWAGWGQTSSGGCR